MRRGDHIGQIEERVVDAEHAMPHRLDPPRFEAREEPLIFDQVAIESILVDDLAARDIDQDRVVLHPAELARADQPRCGAGQRHRDDDDISTAKHIFQCRHGADERHLVVGLTAAVDGVNLGSQRPEQSGRSAPSAAETEDRASGSLERLVVDELVEPPFPHLLVLDRQALGRGQCDGQHELRHGAGIGARIRGNGHVAREEMQRHVIDACGQELDEAERRHR